MKYLLNIPGAFLLMGSLACLAGAQVTVAAVPAEPSLSESEQEKSSKRSNPLLEKRRAELEKIASGPLRKPSRIAAGIQSKIELTLDYDVEIARAAARERALEGRVVDLLLAAEKAERKREEIAALLESEKEALRSELHRDLPPEQRPSKEEIERSVALMEEECQPAMRTHAENASILREQASSLQAELMRARVELRRLERNRRMAAVLHSAERNSKRALTSTSGARKPFVGIRSNRGVSLNRQKEGRTPLPAAKEKNQ